MGSLFSKPSVPTYIPPVTEDNAAVQEAARREAARLRKRRGYASTILTGPEGVPGEPSVTKTKLGE